MKLITSKRPASLAGKVNKKSCEAISHMQAKMTCTKGQGTTEYAILVGVLVVIAILAIVIFKPKIQELWDAITDGINSL